jgi:hypothetical protein
VYKRAGGNCEYCLIPEAVTFATHEIDHIIAEKHGGLTNADNLALACVLCNKYKGSDLASIDPVTGRIASLYHPREERWCDHFHLDNAEIAPLTAKGRAATRLLQFNRRERVEERRLLIEARLYKVSE